MDRRFTYIIFSHETLQIPKSLGNSLILQIGLVLLEQPTTRLGVIGFRDRVAQVCLFDGIEGDDDAVDFGEGFVEVSFGVGGGESDFLRRELGRVPCLGWICALVQPTSSRLMVAVVDDGVYPYGVGA